MATVTTVTTEPARIDGIITAPRARFTLTGMVIEPGTTIEQWMEMGSKLRVMHKSLMWWIGDWLCYGEGSFGEKYSQALDMSDATGYSIGTVRMAHDVSMRIEPARRIESLSFTHHLEVAFLKDKREQDKWLKLARDADLSVSELRMEIRRTGAQHEAERGDSAQWTITRGIQEIIRWFEAESAKQPIAEWSQARREAIAGDLLPLVRYREALLGKLGDS